MRLSLGEGHRREQPLREMKSPWKLKEVTPRVSGSKPLPLSGSKSEDSHWAAGFPSGSLFIALAAHAWIPTLL